MDLKFQLLDPENELQIAALVKWDMDPELYHLVTPVRQESDSQITLDPHNLAQNYRNLPAQKKIYMISDGGKLIGNFSLQIDPPQLLRKIPKTSWLGLMIGDRSYWGGTAAHEAMQYFEAESKRLGLERVELGVFEFNRRAINFYKKMGYAQFGVIKDLTFYNGRFWDDIRMEKSLIL